MTGAEDTLEAWRALMDGRLSADARVALPVLSGSMRPLLPIGATLEIAGSGWRGRRPGDVVVFRSRGSLTAHRALLILPLPCGPLVYQKGDALPLGAWIDGRRVVGVVTAVISPDGLRLPLDAPAARAVARRLAARNLRWDLKKRLLGPGPSAVPAGTAPSLPGDAGACLASGSLTTLAAVPVARAGCQLREFLEGAAVLAPDGRTLHPLAGTGAFIWKVMDGRRPLAAIVDLLCAEYDVAAGRAAADLLRFVDDLAAAGLLALVLSDPADPAGPAD